MVAIEKKQGGVQPIAVGSTLHCLIAKVAGMKVMEETGALLASVQPGYGVRCGSETVVHSAAQYFKKLGSSCVLKLDFHNAFNSLRWDKLLEAIQSFVPSLFLLSIQYTHHYPCCSGKTIQFSLQRCAAR